uniref:Immunoglobulin V-set domain-containing protein n=1 Tax=Cyprinus carpio TaxID=7962 RepID=A0A8C2G5M7_CYPCA
MGVWLMEITTSLCSLSLCNQLNIRKYFTKSKSKWTPFFSYSHFEMHCYQNDTDYDYKYWYRQIRGEGLVLIGSYNFNSPSSEKGFETGFTMSGTETKKWTLRVDVKEGIDAVYLCAASLHSE